MIVAVLLLAAALLQPDRPAPLGLRMGARPDVPAYVLRVPLPPSERAVDLPAIAGPEDASRPLVVIDPGHGGHDPGASGAGGLKEAQLTLALGRALRDELVRRARVRVALTRDGERFLALEERYGLARRLDADLFISIHADAAAEAGARGASLYTLSERASDAVAARLAARENRADTINGVQLREQPGEVAAILLDLSRRQTFERSAAFARLVVREGANAIRFRAEPLKSAAFVVLKAPDVPSVLFESGYISNADDAARLTDPAARARFAAAFARAIEAYFARVRG
ncbi:MAG: N-acetylmuramoyl-L-alanine amidase [Novosphingobium sp.]|nr:N-acetylmuramoyl-L-alanine amidase [Novosphingobium sp.]